MVSHMKTTLNIDDSVMQRLREEAARQGRTMSELVEGGLRLILDGPRQDAGAPAERRATTLPTWDSGGARVDLADREALRERMEGD
jgi:hypothetical protein